MQLIKPIIEYYADGLMDSARRHDADVICRYLNDKSVSVHHCYAPEFYSCIENILKTPYYHRILLYLPFCILSNAPTSFKETYVRVWRSLLDIYDARENFHTGDVFEVDARPGGDVERVVKCAHLAPWLLKYGYLKFCELWQIMYDYQDDEILIRSFGETFNYALDQEILHTSEIDRLKCFTNNLPERKKIEPTYISEERLQWLEECKKGCSKKDLITPNAHLEGPFTPNLAMSTLPKLQKGEIAFIGGSRLKGYGVEGSDFDVYKLSTLMKDPKLRPGSPHAAHIYYDCACIGDIKSTEVLKSITHVIMGQYAKNTPTKAQVVERLEMDLLQYRLLHKGFQRFTGETVFATSKYTEMDGDCPFYDDEYRKIATMLYAKYVYIP